MRSKIFNTNAQRTRLVLGMLSLVAILTVTACKNSAPNTAATESATTQAAYNTAADAGHALLAAAQSSDPNALARVLGTKARALVTTGNSSTDKDAMDAFAAKYNRMNRWVTMTDGSQVLHIGADNYEFPIPLSKDASGKWQFDAKLGEQEITARNIGRNELLAIDAVSAIANAEEMYFKEGHDGNPAHQYAQLIVSNAGKQDGLYWDVPAGQPDSPLGRVNDFLGSPLSALPADQAQAFDGYAFRILSAQGEKAKGGAKVYTADGKLKKGFAIIASPVKYGETGIMTFVLNREGIMYQKDFGAKTADLVQAIDTYNPDEEWASIE
jgi:Protein of unknown function (DUF2950)